MDNVLIALHILFYLAQEGNVVEDHANNQCAHPTKLSLPKVGVNHVANNLEFQVIKELVFHFQLAISISIETLVEIVNPAHNIKSSILKEMDV